MSSNFFNSDSTGGTTWTFEKVFEDLHAPKDSAVFIDKIIYQGDTTVVIWNDGFKSIVRRHGDDVYDKERAVALCIAYRTFGSKSAFKRFVESGEVHLGKEEKAKRKK